MNLAILCLGSYAAMTDVHGRASNRDISFGAHAHVSVTGHTVHSDVQDLGEPEEQMDRMEGRVALRLDGVAPINDVLPHEDRMLVKRLC